MGRFFIIMLSAAIMSCQSSNRGSSKTSPNAGYKQIAEDKLGEDVDCFFNESKTFVLCTYKVAGTSQQPSNSLYYLVIKLSDNSIVLENRVQGGTVSWYSQKVVQLSKTPGMIRKDQTMDDFITLYDIETGESYPKNQKETH